MIRQLVTADSAMVSAIRVNNKGEVFAAVYNKGLYKLENGAWRLVFGFSTTNDPLTRFIGDFIFDRNDPAKIYFITSAQLFSYSNGHIVNESPGIFKTNPTELTCLLSDNEGGLWIGSSNGAYQLKNNKLTFFDENNGFTNARIFCMFKDSGGNVWFGTDGSGLYQYPHNSFLIYDKTQGLNNNVVMGLAKGSGNEVFISTYGKGVFTYKNNTVAEVTLPGSELETQRINCIYADSGNALWIGTDNSELWKMDGRTVKKVFPKAGGKGDGLFASILQDSNNKLWLGTGRGCFYLKGDDLVKIKGIDEYCTSLLEIGKDSILAGAQTGVKLISNNRGSSYQAGFPNLLVLCLETYQGFLIAGTNDRGLFLWNKGAKSFQNITTKQGLNSNSVMSLQIVGDQLWVGTGRGVNKFILNRKGDHLSAVLTPFSGIFSECNENAMLKTGDYLAVGTTHGLNLYPINGNITPPAAKLVIENVQTYTSHLNSVGYSFKNGYKLPSAPSLPSAESHISIKFQAIQYNAAKTYYEYKLDGLDENFSKPTQSNVVDYPSLPPSAYIFMVKTVTGGGTESAPVLYRFTITPAFYQTIIFRILAVLLFLLVVLGIYLYKRYSDRQKDLFINQLRLIEQEHVRLQTAEDFHDDLGNKLTRINMLSELLDKKIPAEVPDQKKIIQQIRTGVSEMYSGTKNILWALNPKNDNLGEIINEVKLFGESLFEHSATSFTALPYPQDLDKIKVPLGYSHNLILIFKELINNILKHAQAGKVTFSIADTSYSQISFKIADDGKGYQTDNAFPGNGIRNVQSRSKKLNGKITTESQPGKGTITTLVITVP